ncbi:MAG: hypothetical protein FWC50_15910 [Planctomycetaceae bacterium]|nr:hypothetical protein [Planctomycetaceae bacterium]
MVRIKKLWDFASQPGFGIEPVFYFQHNMALNGWVSAEKHSPLLADALGICRCSWPETGCDIIVNVVISIIFDK